MTSALGIHLDCLICFVAIKRDSQSFKILRRLRCETGMPQKYFNCKNKERLRSGFPFLTRFKLDNSTGFHVVTPLFHCFDLYHSPLCLSCKWSFYQKIPPWNSFFRWSPQLSIKQHKESKHFKKESIPAHWVGRCLPTETTEEEWNQRNFHLFPGFGSLPRIRQWEAHFTQDSWSRTWSKTFLKIVFMACIAVSIGWLLQFIRDFFPFRFWRFYLIFASYIYIYLCVCLCMSIYFKQLTLLDQDMHGFGNYQRTDAAQEELTLGREPPA